MLVLVAANSTVVYALVVEPASVANPANVYPVGCVTLPLLVPVLLVLNFVAIAVVLVKYILRYHVSLVQALVEEGRTTVTLVL